VIKKPNYTQIPNVYFDEIMTKLNGSENLVFLAIMRKTFGWQKKRDRISYSQLMEITGLAKSTVSDALKSLLEMKFIVSEKDGQNIRYSVVVDDETGTKIEPVVKPNRYENRTITGTKIEPLEEKTGTKIEHTKESNINKLTKENIYIAIESEYEKVFKEIFPTGKLIIDYARTRKRIKEVVQILTQEDIIMAINKAKKDDFILQSGFALSTILTDFQLNKLLNGTDKKNVNTYSTPIVQNVVHEKTLTHCKKCGVKLRGLACPACFTNYTLEGDEV
jgi:phage replication O-like protein O